ncbi:DUF1593 domain-containing protein [Streptococcus suis]|uniref:DUF1593 domain-containing protein n=1 Tax=Streptococcus suis TaxID=1307 RepID=UPI001920495E|nr:DUF1593 domain-containing protein [Streptococcus suis]MBL1125079.1 DUF1593 domain-containing protein [Streptococcus suis]HEM4403603.1 DUF1593 domain-containing protein [Streptococcus suis]
MSVKPRTIVTTDGEIDDFNSFIRLLLYTNDIDLEGIILTSSKFHYRGTSNKPAHRWTGTRWIPELIDNYAKVYPNLIKHDANYPSPEYLHSIYKIGNISDAGEMEIVTEGSEHIVQLLLDEDPRPILIQTWGGTNTTARALKSIQERFEGTSEWNRIREKVETKVILYIILNQDETFDEYIFQNWKLRVINDSSNFGYFAYVWKSLPKEIRTVLEPEWFLSNIKGKGALLDKYALIGDGHYLSGEEERFQFGRQSYLDSHPDIRRYEFISEGDSPSYFYLLSLGLRKIEDPTSGGWGGRFIKSTDGIYENICADYNPLTQQFEIEYGFTRWINDIQADFAARAEWCVADDFKQATHYPKIHAEKTHLSVKPGQVITLTAPSCDPNGLELSYKWYCYFEASSYWDFHKIDLQPVFSKLGDMEIQISKHSKKMSLPAELHISGVTTDTVSMTIPSDAEVGDDFHIILEVQNDAAKPLKSYQRYILKVE